MRGARLLTAAGLVLAATPAALAIKLSVLGADDKPLVGARVCYFEDKVEILCVLTDREGVFELPDSKVDTLRAQAEGYLPETFSAARQKAPVVLTRAPTLFVRLVDRATGEPIDKGEVTVVFASGKERGPFPTNAAGVRIKRLLNPGDARVVAKAEGYRDSTPRPVTLEGGVETTIEIDLERAQGK